MEAGCNRTWNCPREHEGKVGVSPVRGKSSPRGRDSRCQGPVVGLACHVSETDLGVGRRARSYGSVNGDRQVT